MPDRTSENVLRMRALAAQMRGHAAETCQESFRRKFEAVAADLELRADLEDQPFPAYPFPAARFPGTGNGRGYWR